MPPCVYLRNGIFLLCNSGVRCRAQYIVFRMTSRPAFWSLPRSNTMAGLIVSLCMILHVYLCCAGTSVEAPVELFDAPLSQSTFSLLQVQLQSALERQEARAKRCANLESALLPLRWRLRRDEAACVELEGKCPSMLAEAEREAKYFGAVISTRHGPRTREEAEQQTWAWAKIAVDEITSVRSQLDGASAEERPLVEAQLQFLELRASQSGAIKIFEDISARRAARAREASLREAMLSEVRERQRVVAEGRAAVERGSALLSSASRFVEVCFSKLETFMYFVLLLLRFIFISLRFNIVCLFVPEVSSAEVAELRAAISVEVARRRNIALQRRARLRASDSRVG